MRLQRVGFWVYNFGPAGENGRTPADLDREVNALCNVDPRDRRRTTMKLGAATEALRWRRLPDVRGFQRIHRADTPGRANLALWVNDGLHVADVDYIRHFETWERTKHAGIHPPRETMRALIRDDDREEAFVFVTHGPPVTPTSGDARAEWVDIMVKLIEDSHIPVNMLGDPNGLFNNVRAKLANPKVSIFPDPDDSALLRGYTFSAADTRETVNRVPMGSDHGHALLGRAVRR